MFGIILGSMWLLFLGLLGPWLLEPPTTLGVLVGIACGSLLTYLSIWYCMGALGGWIKGKPTDGGYPR